MFGASVPKLVTPLPGPRSRAHVDALARHECPAITARRARRAVALAVDHDDPVVWAAARGTNVRDVDGNVFVDLTAGFGVALLGHAHPEIVAAATAQSGQLVHGCGDAWPDASRVRCLEAIAAVTPPGLDVVLLGTSGSDAVEAARKTAYLATGRPGVLVFDGAYHGLSLGALPLQGYRDDFVAPFRPLLGGSVTRLPYGCPPAAIDAALASGSIGSVVVEPVLGRGGAVVPPPGWLAALAASARAAGALVVFDEIQTGCGRTGAWFAGPAAGVVPDLLCVGKALGGGFPISACVGSGEVMAAWGTSKGEALHTQTFLGHPVATAAAVAALRVSSRDDAPGQARALGHTLAELGRSLGLGVRGAGLLMAWSFGPGRGLAAARGLLRRGFLALPSGDDGVGLTPPLGLSDAQLDALAAAARAVQEELS